MYEFEFFGVLFFLYSWRFAKQKKLFGPFHEPGVAGMFGRIPGSTLNVSVGVRWR